MLVGFPFLQIVIRNLVLCLRNGPGMTLVIVRDCRMNVNSTDSGFAVLKTKNGNEMDQQ